METFKEITFKDFSESISSLFEKTSDASVHNCIEVLGKNAGLMAFHKRLFESFIGNIDDFHTWAKPKLDQFFASLDKSYLTKENERVNRRRYFSYEEIVLSNKYKRTPFKKKMMEQIILDIAACLKDGVYVGEHMDTEEHRRLLFLNFIRNYVLRLFLIPIHFKP